MPMLIHDKHIRKAFILAKTGQNIFITDKSRKGKIEPYEQRV